MYGRRKLPRSFFFVSRVSKITPSPIPINKGGFTGGFENDLRFVYKMRVPGYPFKWFRKNSPHLYENLQGFEGVFWRMIYNLFTKFEFKDIRINGSAKNSPHLYPKIQGFVGDGKICSKIFSPSPISIKMAFCTPLFWKIFTVCLQMPSLNCQRKTKSAPPSKKYLSPIWIKTGFWKGVLKNDLQFVYKIEALIPQFSMVQFGPLIFGQTEETAFWNLFLTYMHEKAVLGTMFRIIFTPYLQISPSPIRTKNGHFAGWLGFYLHFVFILGTKVLT